MTVQLSSEQAAALQELAAQQGKTVEQVAADLIAAALLRVQVVTG